MLQALRGGRPGGPFGHAAVRSNVAGLIWARPWLDQPPEAIQAYVNRHRIRHVEDPSNQEARYARSRLRQQVWPALSQAFPDAEQCLHAAAAHAQDDAPTASRSGRDGSASAR
jgi:tRNA(Ile)-lysidine synthase